MLSKYSVKWKISLTALAVILFCISLIVMAYFCKKIPPNLAKDRNKTKFTEAYEDYAARGKKPEDSCKTYLWRLNTDHYLFGFITGPIMNVWDAVPSIAKTAFLKSDAVYFEIDAYNPNFKEDYKKCKQNLTLKVTQLPKNLYRKVQKFVAPVQKITSLNLTDWDSLDIDELLEIFSIVPYYSHQPNYIQREVSKIEDCITCSYGSYLSIRKLPYDH